MYREQAKKKRQKFEEVSAHAGTMIGLTHMIHHQNSLLRDYADEFERAASDFAVVTEMRDKAVAEQQAMRSALEHLHSLVHRGRRKEALRVINGLLLPTP